MERLNFALKVFFDFLAGTLAIIIFATVLSTALTSYTARISPRDAFYDNLHALGEYLGFSGISYGKNNWQDSFSNELDFANGLIFSFSQSTSETLMLQSWGNALCINHPCGPISEGRAQDLLLQYRAEDQNGFSSSISLAELLLLGISQIIGTFALWQSSRALKIARERQR